MAQCPTPLVSNGTHCIANNGGNGGGGEGSKDTEKSLQAKIFPMPFSIAGVIVLIVTGISKMQNPNTFFSGAAFSFLSLLEWGAFGVFALLYWLHMHTIDYILIAIFALAGVLYLMNFISSIVYPCVLAKDSKFVAWERSRCGCKMITAICGITTPLITFKFMNVVFCQLFNFAPFKAKLENVGKFSGFNFMFWLSTPFSVGSIGLAAYVAYTYPNSVDQLYLQTIDLIIVSVFTFIFGVANFHKGDDFFEEQSGDYVLGKRAHDNDDLSGINQPLRAFPESSEKGGKGERYSFYPDIDVSQPSFA